MTAPGTTARPLRVAIIGSGPAAFYAAEQLLAQAGITVEVDLFDRLPMPYGLVRFGVAPDHPRIKSVTRIFDRIASDPRVRFYGLVEFGRDVQLADLARHYHQVLYATGAAGDRRLGIPGESLAGVHSATAFVGWYNGHPDYREARFELTGANAVVVGMGNVAVDVTRILSTAPGALGRTDAADHAVEAFAHSRVRHVTMLGRRGPAQAAFTNPEIRELGELSDTDIEISPDDISPDEGSHAAPARGADRDVQRKLEVLRSLAQRPAAGRPRVIALRFLASPLEVIDDGTGRVAGVRLVRNALTVTAAGTLVARPTDRQEEIPAGLVLRAVGYRGTSLPGVPFNERWGVILNERGRVLDPRTMAPLRGQYTAGWIKRGPTGVIGTNKPDAAETVARMIEDVRDGLTLDPPCPEPERADLLVRERQPHRLTFADWQRLDAIEQARGRDQGRPRVKFTTVAEALAALGR